MKRLLLAVAIFAAPARAETIFVSDEASDCVTAIDGATLKPITCIHVGQRPRGLVASKDGKTLYVAVGNGNAIAVVDTATRKVLRSFPTPDPETFALSPDENPKFFFLSPPPFAFWSMGAPCSRMTFSIGGGSLPFGLPLSPRPPSPCSRLPCLN
jgi:YVTN family beta-propeller protein